MGESREGRRDGVEKKRRRAENECFGKREVRGDGDSGSMLGEGSCS